MRVLIVSHTNLSWTATYARYFAGRGDMVQVVSFHPDRVPGVPCEFVGVEPFDKYANKQLYLTRAPRVAAISRRFRPDVVLATYLISNGLSAALACDAPLVVSARGGDVRDLYARGDWRNVARRIVIRFVCDRAEAVHCVSGELRERLLELGVSAARIFEWPMGVDLRRFAPGLRPAPDGHIRMICTRKHEPIYDIPTILNAVARLDDRDRVRLTIAGGGHLLEAHRRRVADLGLHDVVDLTGERPNEEIARMLASSDIYISASHSDGTSSSLLEAMACGVFPVVSRIPANTAWVREGRDGLMFTPGRADELAGALRRAIRDSEMRRTAGVENRRKVERDGDLSRNLARTAELLERVVAATRRGAA